ncbi:MAG: ABC transporter permease subunit [Candidatus Riflebacteria bacterium]|nr:ABC transporter permease subunit [Candidatus Riflebacteria bacterium]
MTIGETYEVVLPDGVFENWEQVAPPEGTRFNDRDKLTIEDAKLITLENENGEIEKFLEKNGERFPLKSLYPTEFNNGVRISLKAGRLVRREKIKPDMVDLEQDKTASNTPSSSLEGGDSETTQKNEVATPLEGGNVQASQDSTTESKVPDKEQDSKTSPVDSSLPTPAKSETEVTLKIVYQYEAIHTRKWSSTTVPSPGEVIHAFGSVWSERQLSRSMLYSFLRVGGGLLVAFLIAFPLALMMGTFSKFKSMFSPLMLFGGYLPAPALVPLFMVFFGINEKQKIMFLAFAFTIYLLPLFVKALEEIDNVYLQTGYTLGASRYDILNKVLLPIALPNMFDAIRIGFGVGWSYIMLAEMLDLGGFGLGTLIITSQRRSLIPDIYLVLITIVVLAFITDKIWDLVDRKIFPYRRQER